MKLAITIALLAICALTGCASNKDLTLAVHYGSQPPPRVLIEPR